ncbi:MAG: hypothetical protein DRI69_02315 [Bacteroidetes bacterium]|nr:MAG: hypothetical protein DRI69_02315 [Bacteroidota bacterium]
MTCQKEHTTIHHNAAVVKPAMCILIRYFLLLLFIFVGSITSAQDTLMDTLFEKYQQQLITRDSLYRGFIHKAEGLDQVYRDSCYRILSEDLSDISATSAFEFTFYFVQSGIPDDPLPAWEACIEQIQSDIPLDTLQLCKAYNYSAGAYHAQGRIDEAKTNYLGVIALVPPEKADEELAVAHNNLGAILDGQNDPGGALSNYIRALEIFTQLIGEEHYYIGVISNNIGQAYGILGNKSEQIEIQEKALAICLGSVGRAHPMTANIHLNLGIAYRNTGDRQNALKAFQESLNIREELKDYSGIVAGMSEIASCKSVFPDYYSANEIEEAQLDVINRGVSLFDSSHASLRNAYNNYALLLREKGDIDGALKFSQLAIKVNYQAFQSKNILDLPTLREVGNIDFSDVGLYENKAYLLFEKYELSRDLKFLQASLETFTTGDSLIESIRSELLNGASRKRLIVTANDYYINAIRTGMELYQHGQDIDILVRTFEFIEKSRNWDLLGQYMSSSRKDSIDRNPVLQQISSLKEQLPGIYARGYDTKKDSLNRLVDVLVEQLKKEYPEYFRFLYQYSVASLDDLQTFCKSENVIWLHYFPLSSSTYGTILITADTIAVQNSPGNADSIDFHRVELLRDIESRDWSFVAHAHALSGLILGQYADLLSPGKLYVSSAGILDNIPFDILIPGSVDKLTFEEIPSTYLLQDFTVTLIPSGTFGIATWNADMTLHNSAFIAPDYADNSLQYNTSEIQAGSEIMSGKYYVGHPNSQELLDLLKHTDLLHFAGHSYTHATNLDSIFLLLGDGHDTLYINDLLSMKSSAQLVVLSSCHSASGKHSAEGNIGLAYGFAFAGTPNVISSLWSVSDRESAGIFQHYYEALTEGINSSESLRRAKLAYLDAAPAPAQHPYYWANWVYYGHPVTYNAGLCSWAWLWIPGLLLGLGGLIYWRRH